MPVGRLDLNTEGLLLLTTDGELKRQLELPATGVERSYRARVFGEVSQAQLEELIHGIEIEGVRYGAIDANLERRTGRNGWVEMRLSEGKNREVRRVLEHLGLKVSRLIRTAYGPFALGDLPAGAVDEVRQHDLVAFRKTLVLPADFAGRGTVRSVVAGLFSTRTAPPPALRRGSPSAARPGRQEVRIIAGEWRGRPIEAPAGQPPARPATAPAKACSRCSPAGSAASKACRSPICSPAPARSASKRCRAAPRTAPSSRRTAPRSTP